jgi:II/X family phage/plasmid replication protein
VKLYGSNTLMVGVQGDGRTQVDDTKLKGSRRSIMKIYAKGAEVKLKDFITRFGFDKGYELYNYAQRLLRVECCFRSMHLKSINMQTFSQFTEEKLMSIFTQKRDSLELPANIELLDHEIKGLKPRQVGVYHLWHSGRDLRECFAKGTLSRYAKEFQAMGINLYAPPREIKKSNVIPMFKVLEAQPALLPYSLSSLIYIPKRRTYLHAA